MPRHGPHPHHSPRPHAHTARGRSWQGPAYWGPEIEVEEISDPDEKAEVSGTWPERGADLLAKVVTFTPLLAGVIAAIAFRKHGTGVTLTCLGAGVVFEGFWLYDRGFNPVRPFTPPDLP